MQVDLKRPRYFAFSLVMLCLLYVAIEFFLNSYNMLSIDEFWFAHIIYHYQEALPYRDFAPYKTVLGYYLLLPPLLAPKDILPTLFFTKHYITLINTAVLLVSSFWLTRYFSRFAVLTSLILLLASDIVLMISTNIRVDLLGYWFCFFALLCLLEQRFFFAGLLLGLGFMTSQKAIWYIFATNIALAAHWLIFARHRKTLWCIIYHNLTIAAVIAAYIAFWSAIADLPTVMSSIFHEASVLYQLDWYASARKLFWTHIIQYNPFIILLWPFTFISLLVTFERDESYAHRFFAVIVGFVILLCLIPYKMIFPYYMQVAIPALLMLYAAFFTWLFKVFQSHQTIQLLIPKNLLWACLVLYLALLIYIKVEFTLHDTYLLIGLIPLLLITFINHPSEKLRTLFCQLILLTMAFTGMIYPLLQIYVKTVQFSGDYQQAHIKVMNSLLNDGSDYVAGIELIYNKTQPIAGMRQLVGPAIDYLANPSEKLRPFMLASLYQDPNATSTSIIAALKKANVKFYVNTYRMDALPANIKTYLQSQYEHFWGSLYLYAPSIAKGENKIALKFSGRYLLEANAMEKIVLNRKAYQPHTFLYLDKGTYLSMANQSYRLKLMPEEVNALLDNQFQKENLMKIVW